jgi:hypothetical protein
VLGAKQLPALADAAFTDVIANEAPLLLDIASHSKLLLHAELRDRVFGRPWRVPTERAN